MGLHIVIVGNPKDGFCFYGPFKTADHAIEEAEQTLGGQNWWIAPLEELFIEQSGEVA